MALTSEDHDLLTTAEAAELLRVSPVTVLRWIKQGRLPAYRLGPRAVRVRRADLNRVVRSTLDEDVSSPGSTTISWDPDQSGDQGLAASIRTLSQEEIEQALEDLQIAKEERERMAARWGGEPLSPSWPIINASRDEWSGQV